MQNGTVGRATLPSFTLRERQVFHGARARVLYELIAWKFRNDTDLRFMNYGYFAGDESAALAEDEAAERYSAALYEAVATQVPLAGRRVLDVGTGRGGGASFVQRHLGAAETVGCDIAHGAIAFCERVHAGVRGLSFRQGDALALPFAAESYDAVLNVESAHCYTDRAAFFSEVFRVLRPGGQFLMADFTPPRTRPEAAGARIADDLSLAGFAPPDMTDITAAILAGLDRDNGRRLREIDARFPRGTRRLARLWAGTQGSWIYRDFAEGRRAYLMYRIEKPRVALPGFLHVPDRVPGRGALGTVAVAAERA